MWSRDILSTQPFSRFPFVVGTKFGAAQCLWVEFCFDPDHHTSLVYMNDRRHDWVLDGLSNVIWVIEKNIRCVDLELVLVPGSRKVIADVWMVMYVPRALFCLGEGYLATLFVVLGSWITVDWSNTKPFPWWYKKPFPLESLRLGIISCEHLSRTRQHGTAAMCVWASECEHDLASSLNCK